MIFDFLMTDVFKLYGKGKMRSAMELNPGSGPLDTVTTVLFICCCNNQEQEEGVGTASKAGGHVGGGEEESQRK